MIAAAWFKIVVAGPAAIYLLFLIVQELVLAAGQTGWVGIVVRLIYAGMFTGICADGIRQVRASRQR